MSVCVHQLDRGELFIPLRWLLLWTRSLDSMRVATPVVSALAAAKKLGLNGCMPWKPKQSKLA